jgi:ribonuclease Z
MKLIFLGTSAMVPTKERNVQSIYLDYNGEGILLDCGEGTQRQLQLANLNAQKITTILISHWHGDHVSGLIGLLQTIGNFCGQEKTIKIFGPPDTKKYLNNLLSSCIFENTLNLEVIEIDAPQLQLFFENNDYELHAQNLEHSVPTLGFRFVKKSRRSLDINKLSSLGISQGPHLQKLQKGEPIIYNEKEILPDMVSTLIDAKTISFIFDTSICSACFSLAESADLLISEAVYTQDLSHKAQEYGHMTAQEAAQVASQSGAQELILTHFSQRFKDVSVLEHEAKTIFPNTSCAYDFLKKELDF